MGKDIRDIAFIDHTDVVGLNFIKPDCKYIFRRHFRQGLRSHILEILDPADIELEKSGTLINDTLHFPKARPKKVLRIFRTRFANADQALSEIQRVKITERILTPDFIARSIEILVEYHGPEKGTPLLCGLQEYIVGVIVDPWTQLKEATLLKVLYDSLKTLAPNDLPDHDKWVAAVYKYGTQFIANVKRLMVEASHIPDLAGIGNVLITPSGRLKLVDINNISKVVLDDTIRVDDRNYPVCDKSIEALALMESKLLGRTIDYSEPIYSLFLTEERKRKVQEIEKQFISQISLENTLPHS